MRHRSAPVVSPGADPLLLGHAYALMRIPSAGGIFEAQNRAWNRPTCCEVSVDSPALAELPLDQPALVRAIDVVLDEFLTAKAVMADQRQHVPVEAVELVRSPLGAGGKRLRPVLCVAGWSAGGTAAVPPGMVLRVAASLEMFHAFALIHDDVIDDSSQRRGQPNMHRVLAGRHGQGRSADAARWLGMSGAILIGDVALAWSDELIHTAGLDPGHLAELLPLIDLMRSEVMYGQYLDIMTTGRPTADVGLALRIARFKTAKYTIERPLHVGATLAGAPQQVIEALSAYAVPLGEAFQLQDDLLGVFGHPEHTGKPNLDDLRDGKHTALIAAALQRATVAQQRTFARLVSNPSLDEEQAQHVRHVLHKTEARQTIESMIQQRFDRACQALDVTEVPPATTVFLRRLAAVVNRPP